MPGMEGFEGFFNEEDLETEIDTEEGAEGAGTKTGGGDPEVTPETDPETDPEGEGGEGGSQHEGGDPGQKGGFSPEMQAAIEAETQKRVDARIAAQFKGMKNPYTGKEITTEAELNAYRAAYAADQRNQKLQDMGIDPSQLNEIVGSLPEVQEARAYMAQQRQQQATAMMEGQFNDMKKDYPDCGFDSVAAMMADPEGLKVLEFWRDSPSLTIADAYLIKNKDKIRAQQTAAAKQGAMNQMNSKGHLKQTKGSTAKGEVPADVIDGYRMYFPKATMAEIAEMYRKNHEND